MSPKSNTLGDDANSPQTRTPTPASRSPIMSAKRPKKRNPAANPNLTTAAAALASAAKTAAVHTPEKNDRPQPDLSPLHGVRPVPSDSHHDGAGCAGDSRESKLSVETELYASDAYEGGGGESPDSTSWVGRKVDAIFSPVLSFLHGATNSMTGDDNDGGEGDEVVRQADSHAKEPDDDGRVVSTKTDTCDSRKYDYGSFERNKNQAENYDGIPTMTNTESSGSHGVAFDGDATMVDFYKLPEGADPNKDNHDTSSPMDTTCYDESIDAAPAASDRNVPDGGDNDDEEEDDDEEEFNPYLFIKMLPPYKYAIPPGWRSHPKALPPLDYDILPPIPPICLVLDLDETLVHCTVEPVADADMIFPVEFNGTEYQVHVRCRPFLQEFLEAVSSKFEVVIFTASQQVYADKLLDKIDPEGKFIRHRIFRDSCLPVEGNFLKDLTILGRDLSQAVLVDNSPHAFGYQVDNGIPIESWFDDPNDRELLKLEMFLRTLHGVDDVRDVVRKTFQIHQLVLDA